MSAYLVRRVLYMLLLLWLVTVVAFTIIQLPQGDFVSSLAVRLAEQGETVTQELLDGLRRRYGLDRPMHVQYLKWFGNVLRGDFGFSFYVNRPVSDVIGERLALTVLISVCSLAFSYGIGIPVGIYSATHQYRFGDYLFMAVGFIGLATPNFLLALVLMFAALELNMSVGGLFSPDYLRAQWSLAKFVDLLKHLPLPVVIVGTAGTAGLIRIMRGQLLDELERLYVITARAKGVSEVRLLFKYPVRVALNPMVSTIGWLLPEIVSGSTIRRSLRVRRWCWVFPRSGRCCSSPSPARTCSWPRPWCWLFLSALTVLGTFISDILLSALDPRIRMSRQNA